ncbi:MAG TPA: hypothetical protein VL966_10655 [Alphaproteobacteria bacterium]|jgi:hypothetical protein|nr:hypothetical protein [Alphaproteobacteria bacterium]
MNSAVFTRMLGRPLATALGWAIVATLVSIAIRFGIVEHEFFRRVCGDDLALPLWCWPRQVMIMVFDWWVFGALSVLCALYALVRPDSLRVATAAVIFGAIGVALYNAGPASVGLVLGLTTLARERIR